MLVGADFGAGAIFVPQVGAVIHLSALHTDLCSHRAGGERDGNILDNIYIVLDKHWVTYIVVCFIPGYIKGTENTSELSLMIKSRGSKHFLWA